ncbi:aldo/keto reductase [Candidatus Thorarchaeota archaeon]|nr:MAG: aldo/keto reductase [Candidatus Thorarchaeota archaeon]
MKSVKLGRTGLRISQVVLGSMQLGWLVREDDAMDLLDAAFDAGITTIDTADIYSKWAEESYAGKSEQIIGRWLEERGIRDEVVLATKVRGEISNNPNDVGLSRKHILEAVDGSLDRLRTDWIDIYWSHWPDPDVTQEETLRALTKLVDDGSVHYIGASNHNAAELMESLWVSDKYGLARYDALQPSYSLARRRDFEKYLEPVVKKYNLGVTSYSPLGGGFLTGKYSKEETPDSKRAETTKQRYYKERNFRILDTLEEISEDLDATIPQIALAWVLNRESITAPIIGVNSKEQLEENIEAIELDISDDAIHELNEASDWRELDELAR